MKSVFSVLAATSVLAIAAPASAGDYIMPGTYDGAVEYHAPVPPRPVPDYRVGRTETIVTTTRRIVTHPDYDAAYGPQAVVTTRRVVGPAPVYGEPLDIDTAGSLGRLPPDVTTTGSLGRAVPPLPPRRVYRDVVYAPGPERVVTTRRVAPAPLVIEERRVETTRRIIGPAPADWE